MPLFGLSLILVFIIELILYIKDRRINNNALKVLN